MDENYLLEVEHLNITFEGNQHVVEDLSFSMEDGEILGIVGESGSGKTMTALSVMGLLPKKAKVSGSIFFNGQNLIELNDKEFRKMKGLELSMIFQEPMTSLNPVWKVGPQVEEMLSRYDDMGKTERKQKVLDMFLLVGLNEADLIYDKYPHQLSGGMRQRIMIAMAMICRPGLLIADEATTALDVTTQSQILDLILKLNREYETSVIFISHDLGVIRSICSRAIVMYRGKIVEEGPIEELFYHPKEEYVKQLLEAVPGTHKKLVSALEVKKETKEPILKVEHLDAFYEEKKKGRKKQVLKDVGLVLNKGEILGVVGESGCGKSTLAKAVAGILKDTQGNIIRYDTKPQMVFQDPYSSLNPSKKIGWILEEPLKIRGGFSKEQRKERVMTMLNRVGLQKEHENRYLSELSGGQRQRVSIAAAIMLNEKLIILDEPVSALDVTVQAQILDLLQELRREFHLSYLFISHDLNVIRQMCDRVCVMYEGKIVETAEVEELYHNPKHYYSRRLIESMEGHYSE